MDRTDVLRMRLAAHHLLPPRATSVDEVLRGLTAVQSQEYAHGFWSLGQRTVDSTYAQIKHAFDAGDILRTHILRPTWHFVSPADIRWVLQATSPRVQQINSPKYRQLGLEPETLIRAADLILEMLAGGTHLTRPQIRQHLERTGIDCPGERLSYLVMNAELEGLICSGPMNGAQHTYAVLEERVPPTHDPDDLHAQLALRFFLGHGPASEKDLARWSSLTGAQTSAAIASVADQLTSGDVDGQKLWWSPALQLPEPSEEVFLLPMYDECWLSYPQLNFPVLPHHPHEPGEDRFVGPVIVDLHDAGTWRRTVTGKNVKVELVFAPSVTAKQRRNAATQVERLGTFLEKKVQLSVV